MRDLVVGDLVLHLDFLHEISQSAAEHNAGTGAGRVIGLEEGRCLVQFVVCVHSGKDSRTVLMSILISITILSVLLARTCRTGFEPPILAYPLRLKLPSVCTTYTKANCSAEAAVMYRVEWCGIRKS